MRPLPTHRQTSPMPNAPVTTDVHETLDVHGRLSPKGTLDLEVAFDLATKPVHIVIVEVLSAAARIDTTRLDNLLRSCRTDALNVR